MCPAGNESVQTPLESSAPLVMIFFSGGYLLPAPGGDEPKNGSMLRTLKFAVYDHFFSSSETFSSHTDFNFAGNSSPSCNVSVSERLSGDDSADEVRMTQITAAVSYTHLTLPTSDLV